MKIGLITTLDTNIGDDFIRAGVCGVLKQVFAGHELECIPVNKHQPYTVYPAWHPIHLAPAARHLPRGGNLVPRLLLRYAPRLGWSRFDDCDLIVQCGTPVVWRDCARCEWAVPLWHEVVGRLAGKGTPVLNLGAGSCYAWENQPQAIESAVDADYLQRIVGYCRTTTVRDDLAQRLLQGLGASCDFIPCPALLAGQYFAKPSEPGDLVVINYMERGGHYDWGQNIDAEAWKHCVCEFVANNRSRHRFLFVCHDQKEYDLAAELDPKVPRCLPKSLPEYFKVLAGAKAALCNRLHASIALAGMGIPSVSVGTDTRMLMVTAVGLPCFYVKEASLDVVQSAFDVLLGRADAERSRLLQLREETFHRYVQAVEQSLKSE